MSDFKSFYIKYPGHPGYNSNEVIVDNPTDVIVNKVEMILFTNKGEVYGQPDLGADLYRYLHETYVPTDFIEDQIRSQFNKFIPEMSETTYSLELTLLPGTFGDILYVDFTIDDRKVNAVFA